MRLPIKVNAFNILEADAVITSVLNQHTWAQVRTVMVPDSMLDTHFRNLRDHRSAIFQVMCAKTLEMRLYLDRIDQSNIAVMFDIPVANADFDTIMQHAKTALDYKADSIKLELGTDQQLDVLRKLVDRAIPSYAHIGFTPQFGGNRFVGKNEAEKERIRKQCYILSDSGILGVIFEGMPTKFVEELCNEFFTGLDTYSIFSGRPENVGLSINVWDAMFKASEGKRFFPKTASYSWSDYPFCYNINEVEKAVDLLLQSIRNGSYPIDR